MLTTLLRRRFLGAGAIFASSSRQLIFAGTYNTPARENQFPPLQTHALKIGAFSGIDERLTHP